MNLRYIIGEILRLRQMQCIIQQLGSCDPGQSAKVLLERQPGGHIVVDPIVALTVEIQIDHVIAVAVVREDIAHDELSLILAPHPMGWYVVTLAQFIGFEGDGDEPAALVRWVLRGQ